MIAGSVANNVGFSFRQLHLILVEKCADCWFMCLRLQVATGKGWLDNHIPNFDMAYADALNS